MNFPKPANLRAATVLIPSGAIMLACAFVASPGLFNIDEVMIWAGAKAFLETGGFTVENGWTQFRSTDLTLWLLVPGPNGLAPQYPPGSAVLGAPLLAAFGLRGLMLINVAAAIGTLFVLWTLAKRHFGRAGVALAAVALLALCTFWLEYAYAMWPHAVGVLAVTLALLLILEGLEAETPALKAAGAGAAIGAGLLFRTDTMLAVPALGLITILFAARPFRIGVFFAVGLAPFVALTAAANLSKFGTLNPLSYGASTAGSGTSLSTHLVPVAVLAGAALLIVVARLARWRPRRRDYLLGLALLALGVAASSAAREFLLAYGRGAWALVVDATTIDDPRHGVTPMPGGLLYFWGLWKKALGQSMPWLGLLLLAIWGWRDLALRRLTLIVGVLFVVWSLPFFAMSWHGGAGGNMRYLLPVLPALCALSARLLIDFARATPSAKRLLALGGLAGIAAVALWTALLPTQTGGAQQILSTWLLALVAAMALLACLRWRGETPVRMAALVAIGAGLGASTSYLCADIRQTQAVRVSSHDYSVRMASLPDRAIVYVTPPRLIQWALQPGQFAAMPTPNKGYDLDLMEAATAKGYSVLVWGAAVDGPMRKRFGDRLVRSGLKFRKGEFIEVLPAGSDASP